MIRYLVLSVLSLYLLQGCGGQSDVPDSAGQNRQTPSAEYSDAPVPAVLVDTGFSQGDSQYHTMVHASDGKVYFAIGTHHRDTHVHMFSYDPSTGKVTTVADIGKELGEDGARTIPQGKIHCDFFERDGGLYFATHVGFFRRGGTEDHGPYPGGHFMRYDLAKGTFTDYGIGIPEQGIVTMNMDTGRSRMYGITVPDGIFMYYDLATGAKKSFGPLKYSNEPRSLGIDPRDGNVYWARNDSIYCYRYDLDRIVQLAEPTLDRPVLQVIGRNGKPGEVTWRSVRWNERYGRFYGITFLGEYLFSFEPRSGAFEVIDRLTAGPNRKSGELAPIASLAFELSHDNDVIYSIGSVVKKEPDAHPELHLVTYTISLRRYRDHGPIQLSDGRRPTYCQSMEIGRDGNLYLGCDIPVLDTDSDKAKRILALKGTYRSPEQLNKGIFENNLVIVKDPLR